MILNPPGYRRPFTEPERYPSIDTQIIEWLEAHRDLALYAIPCIAFAEACPGIGLFVSGIILVSVCSLIGNEQLATIQQMLPLAFAGALLADHAGFYLGRGVGPGLHRTGFARRYAARLTKAEGLIRRHGWVAILIGRFVPAIRSIIPLLAGVSRFDRLRYSVADVGACLLWTLGLGLILTGVEHLIL